MKRMTFAAGLLLLCAACRKHDEQMPVASISALTKLQPGNYWIYRINSNDTAGNFPAVTGTDSVYVEQDTVIGTYTYHTLRKPESAGSDSYITLYLRDSSGYLVDHKGVRRLSNTDFTDALSSRYLISSSLSPVDSVGREEIRMADRGAVVTVPAGTFATVGVQTTWYLHPSVIINGRATRRTITRYAAGVGVVTEMLPVYLQSPFELERRLIRYHVAP